MLLLKVQEYFQDTILNFALSNYVGTASLALVAGWLSKLGLPMKTIAVLILIAWFVMLLFGYRRYKWRIVLPGRQLIPVFILLLAVVLIGWALVLFPLAIGDGYSFLNDTSLYIAHSEYLQTHGFLYSEEKYTLNQFPILSQVSQNQLRGLRMGAIDFLALVQSLVPGEKAIVIFPAVSAWAVSCVILAFFGLLHGYFRLPIDFSILAVGIFSINLNPISSAAMFGFLPQTLGLAGFIWCIFLLTQISKVSSTNWSLALLSGLIFSFTIIAYSAILPILVVAFVIYGVSILLRSFRSVDFQPRLATMLFCIIAVLLFSNYELMRGLRSILFELQMLNLKIGWNVEWNLNQFIMYTLGAMGGGAEYWVIKMPWSYMIALLSATMLLIGFGITIRHHADWLVLILIVLFCLGWVYYSYIAINPWTGQSGQTWGTYKLGQYSYILVFPLQMLGLYKVLEKAKLLDKRFYTLLIIGIEIPFIYWQYQFAYQKANQMQVHFTSPYPVRALTQMSKDIASLNPERVFMFAPEQDFWLKRIFAYILYPLETSIYTHESNIGIPSQKTVCIFEYAYYGFPFEPTKIQQALPASAGLVNCTQPVITSVQNINGVDYVNNHLLIWLGNGSTTIEIWSGVNCSAALEMKTIPGPSITSTGLRHLRIRIEEHDEEAIIEPNSLLRTDFLMKSGQSTSIVLTPLDDVENQGSPNGDTRPMILGLTSLLSQCVER